MNMLENSTVMQEKNKLFESILENLESLKFNGSTSLKSNKDVEEKIKIEQFNYEINDLKSVLQVAYECLYSNK